MSSPSNLYVEKVFAEQPSDLWSLDDQADYISLISETDRNLFSWNIDNGIVEEDINYIGAPFSTSTVSKITPNVGLDGVSYVTLVSDDIISTNDLNKQLGTFAISTYLYSQTPYLSSIQIGYQYFDGALGSIVQKLKNYDTSVSENWLFVSETFSIPSDIVDIQFVLKIGYINLPADQENYIFYQNGFTFGQWSENFHSQSLGVHPVEIPSDINLNLEFGIEAKPYGLSQNSGYYLIKDNALVAKNVGMPLVYGSSNITKLIPNGDLPSLILPGNGFLNNVGKYKEQTLEFWLRAKSDSSTQKRIMGPIASDDGLYVNGPFVVLKIGNNFGSHYVGQWERPMLIQIRVSNNSANLVINGEQVILLNYLTDELSFPNEFENGKSQDWIGFYAYDDITPIEIDCVSLYSYQVPLIIAKRRFVYGQGVEYPENINNAYSGTSVYVDYSFADYTNNYTYPDIGRWVQGFSDNIDPQQRFLSVPQYTTPEIKTSSGSINQLIEDINSIQDEEKLFISLKPNASWQNIDSHIYINNFNLFNRDTVSFYGVFKRLEEEPSRQTLIRIEDIITNSYFTIDLIDGEIRYILKYSNGNEQTVYTAYPNYLNEVFSVGLNINDFSNYYGGNVASFFGNRSALSIYVGGTKNFTNTFAGHIYKFDLCSERNIQKAIGFFNSQGVPVDYENIFDLYPEYVEYDAEDNPFADGGRYDINTDTFIPVSPSFWDFYLSGGVVSSFLSESLMDHKASYSLKPRLYFNNFRLDIDIDGYWEDQIPLTYFAQYTTGPSGKRSYSLDFIQFNIDYPAPAIFSEEQTVDSWTYSELFAEYQNPIQRTYESLDNQLFTGYDDYTDLKNKSAKIYRYDTSNSVVKTYITFQYTQTGANAPESYFINTVPVSKSGIVKPGNDWITTRYEVVDHTIIYPPAGIDINDLSIVTHVHFNIPGLSSNPVQIRSLQYASQAFNGSSPNKIGTRFGSPIYPYKKSGVYFDYKSENPYSIHKGSTPYLYMTKNSGLQLRGNYDPLINRGLSIPINSQQAPEYKVMAMQSAIRFNEDFFPYAPTEIFEIESKSSIIKFFMVANSPSGDRAKIYAINAETGEIEDGITFYWNGKLVKEPVMTINEWGILGISFSNILNFNSFVGSIRFNGPIIFNNVSYYQSTNLQEIQRVINRPWFKVKYSGSLELLWDYWLDGAFLWGGVLVVSSTSYYGVNPSDIYKAFTGTNTIVVEDDSIFSIGGYQYSVFQNVSWQSQVQNAL